MLIKRTFKNFGHQSRAPPLFSVLWQGFLTFGFIGCGLNWNKLSKWFTEKFEQKDEQPDSQPTS